MKRLVAALFAVLVLLATPAMAAEQVETLPPITSFTSARMDLALDIDDQVLIYAKAEYAGDSVHVVAVDAIGKQVIEIVLISNRVYLRQNTDTRWQATTVEIDDPGDVGVPVDVGQIEDLIKLYNLGTVNVRGIPTTQYQYQVDVAAAGGAVTPDTAYNFNLFIGNADGYPHKFQATLQDSYEGTITKLQIPLDIYDFNQPIVIGAPDPSLVDEMGSMAVFERSDLPGADLLPLWMRPLEEWSLQAKGLIK